MSLQDGQAVKGGVHLDRVKMLGIIGQPVRPFDFFRVKSAGPILIGPAGSADVKVISLYVIDNIFKDTDKPLEPASIIIIFSYTFYQACLKCPKRFGKIKKAEMISFRLFYLDWDDW